MAIMSSCVDKITMLTVVNKDGSCRREITFKSDSTEMKGNKTEREHLANVLADKNWQKQWQMLKKTNGEDSTLLCKASRDFSTIEEMKEQYPLQVKGRPIVKDCRLESHFKWFYTDYTFTETYTDFSANFKVPASKYMEKDEADFWFTGSPNIYEGYSGSEMYYYMENISQKCNKWLSANIIYDTVELMADNYDSIQGITVSRAELLAKRDSLIDYALQNGLLFENTDIKRETIFNNFFHTNCFVAVFNKDSHFKSLLDTMFEDRYGDLMTLEVGYLLTMPDAEVVDYGNGKIKEGAIAYRLTGLHLLSKDYTISATFRSTNLWAYIVSVLIIIIAIGCWVMRRN